MPVLYDAVHITADNTNVFQNRIASEPPTWAKRVRVQLIASDADWLFSCSIDKEELARDAAPMLTHPLTELRADWQAPHIIKELDPRGNHELLVDVNVVTAGEGLVVCQYES